MRIDGYFEPTLISEEVGSKKPAPAIFARLLALWAIPPGELAFVGDHVELDVMGARAAGMTPIWVSERPWPHASPAPPQIPNVLALEDLLAASSETR